MMGWMAEGLVAGEVSRSSVVSSPLLSLFKAGFRFKKAWVSWNPWPVVLGDLGPGSLSTSPLKRMSLPGVSSSTSGRSRAVSQWCPSDVAGSEVPGDGGPASLMRTVACATLTS